MEHTRQKRKLPVRIGRIFAKTVLISILVVLVLLLLVQTPPVQNIIRKKVVAYLEQKLETKVVVEKMSVGLTTLSLGNLYLEDRSQDTLLAGGNALIHLNLLKLLFNKELDVKSILLEDFSAEVKRELPDTLFNFQFLVDAFTSPGTDKNTDTISYAIPKVQFRNIRFSYKDVISGLDTRGFLEELDTRIDALDPANLHIDIPSTEITGLEARFYQYKPLVQDSIVLLDSSIVRRFPRIDLGKTKLKNIKIDFQNHVSSFYANVEVGDLEFETDAFDYANRTINLESLSLANSTGSIHLGRSQEAKKVELEIEEEIEQQAEVGWNIRVTNLDLHNNNLKFDNDNHPRKQRGMDYAHLDAKEFTLVVDSFQLSPDSIGGHIHSASFREQSGFVLEQLRGEVLYANTTIQLNDLYLKTPGSEVKRYARLDFLSPASLTNNFPATKMDFDIAGSYIKVSDILTFAPGLARQPAFSKPYETWYLNLQASGSLSSFYVEQLQFNGLSNTRLDATGSLAINKTGSQTGGALTIRQLHTTQSDIALFTGTRLSKGKVKIPEEFDVTGTLRGGINGLMADLTIASTAGNLAVDGQINNLNNPAIAAYNVNVQTNNFDLGYIFSDPKLGQVTGVMDMKGKGLKAGRFDTEFKGRLQSVGYNNYQYSNIQLDGTLQGSTLHLKTDINDPNIDLNGTLNAVLTANPTFRFNGFVDSIKLEPLHLAKKPVVVRGKIDADIPIATRDHLQADILITQALFVSATQRLPLDSIRFSAGHIDSIQFMNLSSDVATADLRGQFRVSDLGRIFQQSLSPYIKSPSTNNLPLTQPYSIKFTADILNAPVLADLVPGLESFDPIHISGMATSETGLNAVANTRSLNYQGNQIQGLQINITSSPSGLVFTGDIQRLKSKSFDIFHTSLRATALNNKIDFSLRMDDAAARQRYMLSGLLDQSTPGGYVLRLRPDSLMLNYERWNISADNSLTIGKDQLLARNFVLSKGPEILSLQSSGDLLNAGFTHFQLSTITAFLKSDSLLANGRMTGTISFRNLFRQPVFTGNLSIADLSIRGDTLGNAQLKVDNLANRYQVNSTITGRGNDISLTGSFTPSGEKDILLDLDLAVRQLQLSTINGALGGFLKNASGSMNGNITINGSTAKPIIDGPLNFNNASFALNALGSQFRIDGEKLTVTDNGFRFDNFVIRDTANQTLVIDGTVNTSDFSSYTFDMLVKADQFKLLQTTKKDNKIYYGEMVVTTDMHVGGNSHKPVIDGSITVNDGTNLTLVIPQRQPGVVAREGIVEFTDMDNPGNDTLFRAYDSLNVSPFTGMDIAANIEIRKEAVFNIIIDEANGDFLNIQGEAILTSGIDPSGKITLVGNYELERGAYEITFNFLRRRFDIQKGSRIQWFNEPTRANLDVTAVYIANTSPIDLVQSQIDAATPAIRNTYLQKLPFEVRLHLTGELLQPGVAFDIVLPGNKTYGVSNDIITQVDSRLAQLRSDPGETNKQVFALLLLNRFVGENPFETSTDMFSASMYARQSVSKLLTEQLNSLAAGLIDGVDLQFDVVSSEDYTTGERRTRTDLNIGLSKQLLNERLTVAVGTNFELEGSRQTNQGTSGTIGNLSVDYALTRDKRYRIRFYRRNEYQGVVDGYVVETGLSFVISVDYEKFRELITRRKKQKVENVE